MSGTDTQMNMEELFEDLHISRNYDFDFEPFLDNHLMLWDQALELFSAIECQDAEQVRILLNRGVPTNLTNTEGQLPIHVAASCPSTEILELLLDQLKDGNSKWNVNSADKNGSTALHLATAYRYISNVVSLLNHGCSICKVDKNGWTALDYALLPADLKLVKILLKAADPFTWEFGTSAFFTAVRNDLEDVFYTLLSYQQDYNIYSSYNTHLLHYCFQQNKVHYAEYLLRQAPEKIDVTVLDRFGESCLFQLCKCIRASPELVEQLISLGCDVNQPTISDEYPVAEAVSYGRADLAEVMIAHGALVNHTDYEGMTPLLKAVKASSPTCISLLLQNGADMRAVSYDAETVITIALQNSNLALAHQFIHEGYDAHDICLKIKKDIQHGIIFTPYICGATTEEVSHFVSLGLQILPLSLLCRNVIREYFIDNKLPVSKLKELDIGNYYRDFLLMKSTVWSIICARKRSQC